MANLQEENSLLLKVTMTSKLLLIGGASAAGKSSLCQELQRQYGVNTRRLHHYALQIAQERKIVNPMEDWNSLVKEGIIRLIEDANRLSILSCDIHFAIQPIFDTAYAQGLETVEDISEPYARGLPMQIMDAFASATNTGLFLILIEAANNEILQRRKREQTMLGKHPRSLNPISIERELDRERTLFYETAGNIKLYLQPIVRSVSNLNYQLQETVSQIARIAGIRKS